MSGKSSKASTKSKQKQGISASSSKKVSQHSKHRKTSTSSESSENTLNKSTPSDLSKNGSPEIDKAEVPETNKSSKTENSKNLEMAEHSKPVRSTRKRTTHTLEEPKSHATKSRRRSEHVTDNTDDKTTKGKSKTKHRSKIEKPPKQDIQTKSESEISENVQVTPQSPHANIDIPVDIATEHDESESEVQPHVTSDEIPSSSADLIQKSSGVDTAKENEDTEEIQNDNEPANKSEEVMVWQQVVQETVIEVSTVQGDSEVLDYQEEILQTETSVTEGSSNGASELMGHSEFGRKSSSPEPEVSSQAIDQLHTSNEATIDDSSNVDVRQFQSDEDSRSVDAIILHESSNTPPRDSKFNLTASFNSEIRRIETANDDIQNLKNNVTKLFETPQKLERKHKWGDSLAGLELIKPSVKNITIETIKEFCPNVTFLEENEIRMATEHREKKVDVRIPDYKSDDDHSRRYETQSSHEENNSENDNSNIIALNRKISIVEDTASKLRPPPSPARNPVSPVLYITNLVRPFTVKQLKELLERTGIIKDNGFWTDRIKSKCFVHYECSEDAEATRNALHGVNWPIGNGKQLIIEYSTPDEFEKSRNPAPVPKALEKPQKVAKENIEINKQDTYKRTRHEEPEKVPREREIIHRTEPRHREWETTKEEVRNRRSHSRRLSRPRELHQSSRDRTDRRARRTVTPEYRSKKQRVKEEEPQKVMDDLFHKTTAAPSVYWLPLTPEEISTKQQERLLRMAEHKRRIEESTRNRGDHGRGVPYRRRYD